MSEVNQPNDGISLNVGKVKQSLPPLPPAKQTVDGVVKKEVKAGTIASSITDRLQTVLNDNEWKSLLADIIEKGTDSQKNLVSFMTNYLKVMQPNKPVSPEEVDTMQYGLFKQINIILNKIPANEFKNTWSLLLRYSLYNKSESFGESYIFRGKDVWLHTKPEMNKFFALVTLIKKTEDPTKVVAGLKQFSFSKLFELQIGNDGQNRLAAYYNI